MHSYKPSLKLLYAIIFIVISGLILLAMNRCSDVPKETDISSTPKETNFAHPKELGIKRERKTLQPTKRQRMKRGV